VLKALKLCQKPGREVDGAQYEMAVAVRSSPWLPEKSFTRAPGEHIPAVCVEGICVSESVPGFHPTLLSVLVSVRGARGLRTTVSRSDLEWDDESIKLSKVTVELIFEHVQDEVRRLSTAKGSPLSRASTAAKWLCFDLRRPLRTITSANHFDALRTRLPLIVLEGSGTHPTAADPRRRLVSAEELKELPEFWTIESRLVDSLGIISRDLGRELSLNEFLTALAPDFLELRYSAIVPDAHLFRREVQQFHHPSTVEFSRRLQQSVIKWTRKTDDPLSEEIEPPRALLRSIWQHSNRIADELGLRMTDDDPDNPRTSVAVAVIRGDEPGIQVVRTRLVVAAAAETELAKVWGILVNGLRSALKAADTEFYARLLVARHALINSVGSGPLGYVRRDRREVTNQWQELAVTLNKSFKLSRVSERLPESLDFADEEKIFDAVSYWRDWHRTAEHSNF
jgi:hypothetical protein